MDETVRAEQPWAKTPGVVWLQLPCCKQDSHPAFVSEKDAERLVVEAPVQPHEAGPILTPEAGEICTVIWATDDGAAEISSEFLGAEGNEATGIKWHFEAKGAVQYVQRRIYPRVLWSQPVRLQMPTRIEPVSVFAVDVSEGGMRCVVQQDVERPSSSAQITVDLELPAGLLKVKAYVAWWSTDVQANARQVGLEFDRTDIIVNDRIRSHAFALIEQQRR